MGEVEKNTIGVLLLNLGGPDSLQAVRPFLYNLFSDRKIIKLGPSFLQKPLAYAISSIRAKNTKRLYSLIGGKSPILDITIAQAKALEEVLNPMGRAIEGMPGVSFKVYIGMRYWHPLIEEVVPGIYNNGIKKLVALSLYPHYSRATTGSSLSRFKEVASEYPFEVSYITSWYDHPLYIDALVEAIKDGIGSLYKRWGEDTQEPGRDVHVLFSAHSLPKSFVDEGDPYVHQIEGTIEEIIKKIKIKWHLSYQSGSGPVRWIEPTTEETLREFAKLGYKNILIVPISFVSDHIETLYEIDILYKNMAEKMGLTLNRVNSLNTRPRFIEALKDLVIETVKKSGSL